MHTLLILLELGLQLSRATKLSWMTAVGQNFLLRDPAAKLLSLSSQKENFLCPTSCSSSVMALEILHLYSGMTPCAHKGSLKWLFSREGKSRWHNCKHFLNFFGYNARRLGKKFMEIGKEGPRQLLLYFEDNFDIWLNKTNNGYFQSEMLVNIAFIYHHLNLSQMWSVSLLIVKFLQYFY